jgi:DNA polymerase-1
MPKCLASEFRGTVEIKVKWKYQTIDTVAKAQDLVADLMKYEIIAFDTEYNAENDMPVGMSFCADPGMSYYVPFGHTTGEQQLLPGDVKDIFGRLFAMPNITWAMHNGKVELHTLARLGVDFEGKIFDTMVATYCMHGQETLESHYVPGKGRCDYVGTRLIGLKERAKEDLVPAVEWCTYKEVTELLTEVARRTITKGKDAGKEEVAFERKTYATEEIPIIRMAPYATADAYATLLLYRKYTKEMDDNPLKYKLIQNALYKYEFPFIKVLFEMERRGVRLDVPYLQTYREHLLKQRDELRAKLIVITGREDFAPSKTAQLRDILFVQYKLPQGKVSEKTGVPSTDAETINKLGEEFPDHPFLKPLLQYRELEKLIGTYLDTYLGNTGRADVDEKKQKPSVLIKGRVHCDFRQTGTRTGRLSSAEPNIQNITRQEFYDDAQTQPKPGLRMAFIPDPGMTMVVCDYSQIELRILAYYSKDPYMVQAFMEGHDLHKFCASIMFNVPLDQVTKKQRQICKAIGFGILYGMGVKKLARTLGIPVDEAAELWAKYFDNFKGVKLFIEKTHHRALAGKFVQTIAGRRRSLPGVSADDTGVRAASLRQSVNSIIQGSAADLCKIAMLRIEESEELKALGYQQLIQVHDEIVGQCPIENGELVLEVKKQIMQSVAKLGIPLLAEGHFAENWAMAK